MSTEGPPAPRRPRIDAAVVRAWLDANAHLYTDPSDLVLLDRVWSHKPAGYIVEDEPEAFTQQSGHRTGRAAEFTVVDETLQMIGVGLRQLGRAAQPLVDASILFRFVDDFDPDRPPTDPRERALWLRQHCNTGPQQHRLDGRRRS